MTKSAAAFSLTAQRLFGPDGLRKVYFWTFTFVVVLDHWEARLCFSGFLDAMRKALGDGWGGVRVAEVHPAEFSHGLHYHALINRRIGVDMVRRVGRRYKIGRVQVERCGEKFADPLDAIPYLCKYLGKDKATPVGPGGGGARKWAKFGDVPHCKVKDLRNDSPLWVYRREHRLPFTSYRFEGLLSRCWDRGADCFHLAHSYALEGNMATVIGLCMGEVEARRNRAGMLYPIHLLRREIAAATARAGVEEPF